MDAMRTQKETMKTGLISVWQVWHRLLRPSTASQTARLLSRIPVLAIVQPVSKDGLVMEDLFFQMYNVRTIALEMVIVGQRKPTYRMEPIADLAWTYVLLPKLKKELGSS